MKGDKQQIKEYISPLFQLVRRDETNKVFFAASETPGPAMTGSLGTMTVKNVGSWD